jgi:beta-galactosidase
MKQGTSLKGSLYAQSLTPLENSAAEVLATTSEGHPAIVSSHFGKGKTILAGTFLGLANYPDPDPDNDRFFMNLLSWAGIGRPFTTSHDGRTENQVEVRLQENATGYVLYAISHSEHPEDLIIDLKTGKNGTFEVRNILNDSRMRISSHDQQLRLSAKLDRKQVMIWEITSAR